MTHVTMIDVCRALQDKPLGAFAYDLPIKASIQAVSNALRHARYRQWVRAELYDKSANVSIWHLTESGRRAVLQQTENGK